MAFKNNPRIISSGSDIAPMERDFPEASGQSFLVGELVYLTDEGLTVCATDMTKILGIAVEAASGTATTLRKVQIITPESIVRIRVTNGGTDYLNSGATLDIGKCFGTYVASNIHYLDVAETTTDSLTVVKEPKDAAGSATYWVDVKVLPTVCQWTTGE